MKLTLAGWLALAALVSCGKKPAATPDKSAPVLAKVEAVARESGTRQPESPPAAAPVNVVPEDMAPDEEDPSAPDTDPMAVPPERGLTPGQHLDRALEKTGKALQTAGEKTEKGLRKATEKTGKALQKAGRAVESKVPTGEPEPGPSGE